MKRRLWFVVILVVAALAVLPARAAQACHDNDGIPSAAIPSETATISRQGFATVSTDPTLTRAAWLDDQIARPQNTGVGYNVTRSRSYSDGAKETSNIVYYPTTAGQGVIYYDRTVLVAGPESFAPEDYARRMTEYAQAEGKWFAATPEFAAAMQRVLPAATPSPAPVGHAPVVSNDFVLWLVSIGGGFLVATLLLRMFLPRLRRRA